MEKADLLFTYEIYSGSAELAEPQRDLLSQARDKLMNAYAPYSEFRVAAAIELANGEVIVGTNQENAAYPSGLCAERVAIFAAKSQYPDERIIRIAITAQGHHDILVPIPPCGACRQVMLEYELNQDEAIELILSGTKGKIYTLSNVRSLLPLYFSQLDLKKGV